MRTAVAIAVVLAGCDRDFQGQFHGPYLENRGLQNRAGVMTVSVVAEGEDAWGVTFGDPASWVGGAICVLRVSRSDRSSAVAIPGQTCVLPAAFQTLQVTSGSVFVRDGTTFAEIAGTLVGDPTQPAGIAYALHFPSPAP